jgi:hypothetical protein
MNGTENRVKGSMIFGPRVLQATSSRASVGFRRGRSWPRATESGTENAYRPNKLMWSNTSGEQYKFLPTGRSAKLGGELIAQGARRRELYTLVRKCGAAIRPSGSCTV